MIERGVDFDRLRSMRCGSCGLEWAVNAEWLGGFDQGFEACPKCGVDCQVERRPDFYAAPDDPAHEDTNVRNMFWYHSSTQAGWPDPDFDPAALFTEITKHRMRELGIDRQGLSRWAQSQRSKALHLGTYEAAVENMFRRMRDQSTSGETYFLYRVCLKPEALIEPGVHSEPTNFVGDVQLAEICGPDVDVYRYVNTHEDPSSVSLAVRIRALGRVQGIRVPLPTSSADVSVKTASARLFEAAGLPPMQPRTKLERMRGWMPSALQVEVRKLQAELAATLPLLVRDRFIGILDDVATATEPAELASTLIGLARLVSDPQSVLTAIDAEPWSEL
jgi:hypothetical protein